jgi:predicted DNA-binding mobile mystery protein A
MVVHHRHHIGRQLLDERVERTVRTLGPRPARGWIRATRDALGMSTRQLAHRLGVSQPTIVHLEQSEASDTIQLGSLRRVADALDCDLVYALVPRTTLQDTVTARAVELARRDVLDVDRTMRLEGQGLGPGALADRIDARASELATSRRLWDDPPPP